MLTREEASNRKNGIEIFDASDPSHLKAISDFTETVTGGVHSAYINSHYVYITDDANGSLHIIDIADPAKAERSGAVENGEEPGAVHRFALRRRHDFRRTLPARPAG